MAAHQMLNDDILLFLKLLLLLVLLQKIPFQQDG